MLSRKISFYLLNLFFIYDAVFSYYAVTRLSAHEANLTIAYWVEKYPPLYFLTIPILSAGLYLVMYLIKRYLNKWLTKIFGNWDKAEKIILTAFVIYWGVANSGTNFAYMVGFRHTLFNNWGAMSLVGVLTATVYLIYWAYKLKIK
jgi:hypothetical protein